MKKNEKSQAYYAIENITEMDIEIIRGHINTGTYLLEKIFRKNLKPRNFTMDATWKIKKTGNGIILDITSVGKKLPTYFHRDLKRIFHTSKICWEHTADFYKWIFNGKFEASYVEGYSLILTDDNKIKWTKNGLRMYREKFLRLY